MEKITFEQKVREMERELANNMLYISNTEFGDYPRREWTIAPVWEITSVIKDADPDTYMTVKEQGRQINREIGSILNRW